MSILQYAVTALHHKPLNHFDNYRQVLGKIKTPEAKRKKKKRKEEKEWGGDTLEARFQNNFKMFTMGALFWSLVLFQHHTEDQIKERRPAIIFLGYLQLV